jgi:hypothetical protein
MVPDGVPHIVASGLIKREADIEARDEIASVRFWSQLHPERWHPDTYAIVMPDGMVPTQ